MIQILQSSRENHRLQSKKYLAFSWEAEAYILSSSDQADVYKITRALDKSIQIEPTIDRLLWRAKISAADNNFREAEKFINRADSLANNRIILNNKDLERIKHDRDNLIPNSEQDHSE